MSDSRPDSTEDMQTVAIVRLVIGLLQGVALSLLWQIPSRAA